MTRQELEGKTYEEVANLFDQELDEYNKKVDEVMDQEVLNSMESDLMKEMDENNTYLKQVEYELPNAVEFNGKRWTKNDIAAKIIYFLNKNEVEWSYTLGLFELVKLWKNKDFAKISYNLYDQTLRTLNQVKFKGYDEWESILAVNEYMKLNHDNYTKDTATILLTHQKHDAVLKRMQLIAKGDSENQENPTE
jgi:hypothetical protein